MGVFGFLKGGERGAFRDGALRDGAFAALDKGGEGGDNKDIGGSPKEGVFFEASLSTL